MYVLCVLLSHNESQTLAYPLRPRSLRSFRRITLRSGDVRERRTCARERASDDDEEKMTTMMTVASVVARRGADRATTTRRTNAARGRRVLARAEGTKEETTTEKGPGLFTTVEKMAEKVGVSLGPIGMTLQEGEVKSRATEGEGAATEAYEKPKSIANTNTSEWRERYVKKDGTVDLWLEDDFNVASRKAGACEDADTLVNIENYAWAGMKTVDVDAPIRNVKVTDHESGEVLELNVPEGRYILFEAEQQGWVLPNACRMGGCTKCAVKMSKGSVEQPESLGLSKELRDQGYALMCVATAKEDVECVTQDEEEVYMMQFGKSFAELAMDKNASSVSRDDFALEIADMDE